MACITPLTIVDPKTKDFNKSDKSFIKVSCGHCFGCQTRKRNDLYFRSYYMFEHIDKIGGMTIFATLTFDDKHIPRFLGHRSFDKKICQNFLHRLQINLKRKFNFDTKYVLTSELGGLTHRPHHHLLLFVFPTSSISNNTSCNVKSRFTDIEKIIIQTWSVPNGNFGNDGRPLCDSLGIVDIKLCNYGGIQYVTKYVAKGLDELNLHRNWFINFDKRIKNLALLKYPDDNIKRENFISDWHSYSLKLYHRFGPFYMISQGVGKSFESSDTKRAIVYQELKSINGYKYVIPRYYSDRIIRKELKEQEVDKVSELDINSLPQQKKEYRELYKDKIYRNKFNSLPSIYRDSLNVFSGNMVLCDDIDAALLDYQTKDYERRKKNLEKKEQEKIAKKASLVQRGGYRLLNKYKRNY